MDEGVLAVLIGGLIVLVPVAGITARFALKPLIDSIIRVAEACRPAEEVRQLERRVAQLEQELAGLRGGPRVPPVQAEPVRTLPEPGHAVHQG
jgi:hypothetical protein